MPGDFFNALPYYVDSYSTSNSNTEELFLRSPRDFDFYTSVDPNFEVQHGRDEVLNSKLNNLAFEDGVTSERSSGDNFFDTLLVLESGIEVFNLRFENLELTRRTYINDASRNTTNSGVEALVRFDVDTLQETIKYNPKTQTAQFRVSQKADMLCENKKVIFDAELDMSMTCQAKEVVPVSITEYREEISCDDTPAQHVECIHRGAK